MDKILQTEPLSIKQLRKKYGKHFLDGGSRHETWYYWYYDEPWMNDVPKEEVITMQDPKKLTANQVTQMLIKDKPAEFLSETSTISSRGSKVIVALRDGVITYHSAYGG